MSGGAHHAGLLAEGEAGGGARAGHVPPRGPHPQAGPATLPGCGPGFEVQCSAAAPCVRALLVAVAGSSLGSQGQGHAAPACVQGVYGLVGWGAGACKVCVLGKTAQNRWLGRITNSWLVVLLETQLVALAASLLRVPDGAD